MTPRMRAIAEAVSSHTYLRCDRRVVTICAQSTQVAGTANSGQPTNTMKRSRKGAGRGGSVALAVLGAMTMGPESARAVVVYGGSTAANFLAPADDPGWANVGKLNGSSGVYLGNVSIPGHGTGYWVLTASHVGAGSINLGGTSYSAVTGSSFRLTNPDNSLTDLLLYKISSDPGLPTVKLASSTPALGSSLTLIGFGYTGAASPTTWNINGSVWTETTTPSGFYSVGYKYGSDGLKNWGMNTVDSAASLVNDGAGITSAFKSYAFTVSGSAQVATHDSGGASFVKNGGQWELAGINLAVDKFSGQPASTGIFSFVDSTTNPETDYLGGASYMADLSSYLTQIPEPASTAAVTGVLCLLGAAAYRFRREV